MTTPAAASPLQAVIVKLAHHSPITAEDATEAFGVIMRGQATELQVAALLTGLRVRGETSAIVAGVVRALREVMVHLPSDDPDSLVDTCGTGGGAVMTFKIFTAPAPVPPGAGGGNAKNGQPTFSSPWGGAGVLEDLALRLAAP